MPELSRAAPALALSLLALAACEAAPEPTREPASSAPTPAAAPAKPELVRPPKDMVSGRVWVASELQRASTEGRRTIVYVGATWCEPCKAFHDAVVAGKLDKDLANVRFLELDYDEHEAALAEGDVGCSSKLVPLFAVPTEDGRCGDRRHEGAIKGDGAVAFIVPRLKALLERRAGP